MPDEYISRAKALKALYADYAYPAMDIIKEIPAADVAPVVHGQWDVSKGLLGDMCKCSACGSLPSLPTKFCPYCGARMDGGVDHA